MFIIINKIDLNLDISTYVFAYHRLPQGFERSLIWLEIDVVGDMGIVGGNLQEKSILAGMFRGGSFNV